MIRAGIIGATGYAGAELVRILTGHKDVEIKWYGSRRCAATDSYRISTHKRRIPACRFPEPEHSAICMKFH